MPLLSSNLKWWNTASEKCQSEKPLPLNRERWLASNPEQLAKPLKKGIYRNPPTFLVNSSCCWLTLERMPTLTSSLGSKISSNLLLYPQTSCFSTTLRDPVPVPLPFYCANITGQTAVKPTPRPAELPGAGRARKERYGATAPNSLRKRRFRNTRF